MKKYESPVITFNKITFFEKIADTCWGFKYAVFDDPYEKGTSGYEVKMDTSNGCGGGNQFPTAIEDYIKRTYDTARYKEWSDDYNNNSSNYANTKTSNGVSALPS